MRNNCLGLLALILCLLSSCASQKEIIYLQGVPAQFSQSISDTSGLKIEPRDQIYIVVTARDMELSQMFNRPAIETQAGAQQQKFLSYIVDKEGLIDFPQLGSIHVEGMSCEQLSAYIKDELISRGLLKDPIVSVELLGFQVSVMGEVLRPGTFEVDRQSITLFEALSRAGDMTIYGRRDRVKVIRESGSERTIATLDLRGDEILSSPYYYLKQNDIVYVEPNNAKSAQREINQNRTIGTYASVLSVILSVLALVI